MAVIKAQPGKVVQYALEVMKRELISPYLCVRIADGAFVGAIGDTITREVGELKAVARDYEWRTRSAPIVMDDIEGEGKIAFKLDRHVVSATAITLEQLTLDTIKMGEEVVGPQARSVAGNLEAKVLAKFASIPFKRTLAITADHDPLRVVAEAKRLLSADKVAPLAGRIFLVGADIAANWSTSDRLTRYDSTGETGTPALRNAVIGKLAGTLVISSDSVPGNFIHYGHPSALALANVAPVVPSGAKAGVQGITSGGFAGTWLIDYDAAFARDRSMFHSFAGLTDVRDERDADGNLLDPSGDDYATAKNVRGIRITATGFDAGVLETPTP